MFLFARRIVVGVAFAILALAAPLSAQTFRIVPQVGLFANARELPDFDPGISLRPDEVTGHSSRLALGLALEAKLTDLPLAIRLGGVYGTESDIPVQNVVCIESACTSALAGTLAVTADLVVEIPSSELFRPYVMIGAGAKHWSVNREVGVGSFLESETRLAGHLGAGVELGLGPLGVVLEMSDYLTRGVTSDDDGYLGDSKSRHDVFLMMGVSFSR